MHIIIIIKNKITLKSYYGNLIKKMSRAFQEETGECHGI